MNQKLQIVTLVDKSGKEYNYSGLFQVEDAESLEIEKIFFSNAIEPPEGTEIKSFEDLMSST